MLYCICIHVWYAYTQYTHAAYKRIVFGLGIVVVTEKLQATLCTQ